MRNLFAVIAFSLSIIPAFAQTAAPDAQALLEKGFAAQESGKTAEALLHYYQAETLPEARNRITGILAGLGGAGADVAQDYANRTKWLALFKEVAALFKERPPFEIVYSPSPAYAIDYKKGTADLSASVGLGTSEAAFRMLNGLLEQLEKTGCRSKWGFAGWPFLDTADAPDAVVFGGRSGFSFAVECAIVNAAGKTLGTKSLTLLSSHPAFASGDKQVRPPVGSSAVLELKGVSIQDATDTIGVAIAKIDGAANSALGIAASKERAGRIDAAYKAEMPRLRQEAPAEASRLGFWITVKNEEITIEKYTGDSKDVSIPSAINGIPVTAIEWWAFSGKGLTSVTIPNSVTTIGERAFYDNDSLSNIAVDAANPYWVSVDGILFNKAKTLLHTVPQGKKLTSYTIPSSVTTIGAGAFYGNQLTSVTIPNSVTAIEWWAFYGNQLTSVTIPNSVTTIGERAFSGNQLTSVTIPNSVTTIGWSAFYGNQLTSVTIPNSVTAIGREAFSDNQLTSITIPNSVTFIGDSAFAYNKLTSITIPNSIATIGAWAFSGNKLTSVTIPNSVTAIEAQAFPGNPLTSVTLPQNVQLGSHYYQRGGTEEWFEAFNNGLDEYYNNNGKRAGTYLLKNGQWSRR